METTPAILHNVLYDTHERMCYCLSDPPQPINTFNKTILFSRDVPLSNDIYYVKRPTYMTNYLHSCFGHAYIDHTLPLISILHEYSPDILAKRGFKLFVFKDTIKEQNSDPQLATYINTWEASMVDFAAGAYREPYSYFHQCISDAPILFEKTFTSNRYIHFDTIIYNGNVNEQRTIHSSNKRYPGRIPVAISTDKDVSEWVKIGKRALLSYLGLQRNCGTTLFIARRGFREFTIQSRNKISVLLDIEPTYLEDYSLPEQIQMFLDADTVIAAHGSGLYHLIWCKPGTRVIEIFGTNDSRKIMFESYANFLGLSHTRIECSTDERITEAAIEVPDWALALLTPSPSTSA